MNKSDYLAQVEALKASSALRARIAALPRKAAPRSFRVGRWLSLAACLVLIAGAALTLPGLLRSLRLGGDLYPAVTPPSSSGALKTVIPDETLAHLLAAEYDGAREGDTWELLYSAPGEDCTMGALLYTSRSQGGGLGTLLFGVFENDTQAPLEPVLEVRGDAGALMAWTDRGMTVQLLWTNATAANGREHGVAGLYRFDGRTLSITTRLPFHALEADLPEGAEDMLDPERNMAFWVDRKAELDGAALRLYRRNPGWSEESPEAEAQWQFECLVPMDTSTGPSPAPDPQPGAGFGAYQAPILPMTAGVPGEDGLMDPETPGITAERTVTFDCSQAQSEYCFTPTVIDRYVLRNETGTDYPLTLYYPFYNSLTLSEAGQLPAITVDGAAVAPRFAMSHYPAGFTSDGLSMNYSLGQWEDYTAFYDGFSGLLNNLFRPEDESVMPDWTVTVYSLEDIVWPEDKSGIRDLWSVNLAVDVTLTELTPGEFPSGKSIHSYGFGGLQMLGDNTRRYSTFLNEIYEGPYYLITNGQTITDYTVTGYQDGACSPGDEIPGFSATLRPVEMTMGDAFRLCAETEIGRYTFQDSPYLLMSADVLALAGAIQLSTGSGVERYAVGRMEDLFSDAASGYRFCYRIFGVTVPAGGSVAVESRFITYGSSNNVYPPTEEDDAPVIRGYDVATQLGSGLDFRELHMVLIPSPGVPIVNQNIGFDTQGKRTEVSVDPAKARYFFEIQD